MAKLVWSESGSRLFEAGVDRGVLYVKDKPGVPWNGLISVAERSVGGKPTPYYSDGVKYMNVAGPEDKEGTIEAYTSPPEFDECDGVAEIGSGLFMHQQRRTPFHLAYRTGLGNDLSGLEYGYKIHLIYNALAAPSDRGYTSLSSDTDVTTLSWDYTTTPIYTGPSLRPTAHAVIDSTKVKPNVMATIEDILYGTPAANPRMPELTELIAMFPMLKIIDNGDGTWTATGTDYEIQLLTNDLFRINSPGAEYINDDTYRLRSVED